MNKLLCRMTFFVLSVFLIFPVTGALAKSSHIVVVDPAHGGRDKGVSLSENVSEKDVTLAIARLLKKDLDRSKNIKVLLTRTTNENVSISDRVKIAKKAGTDVFISLHINAGFGRKSSGFEVYFPGFDSATGKNTSNEILKDMVTTEYLNEGVKFAQIIQKNMGKIFSRKDRGLRSAPILVLEGLTVPAVVLEIGFATNTKDKKKLLDKATQKSIARALAKSVEEFFKYTGAK
ncbi:MAG: N-acetylmuramoyl-L-alanine amidase [Syntrophales bacterium]|nr:N-acetylmuramoyl-L-alanine amidase [Syntrophales bacterium]